MSSMISIDFGNSYTKVAIRRDKSSESELLRDENLLTLDQLNMCVPTLAAKVERKGRTRWVYATEVTEYSLKTPGLTVYRNWKPYFFREEMPEPSEMEVAVTAEVSGTQDPPTLSRDQVVTMLTAVLKRVPNEQEICDALQSHSGAANESDDFDIKALGSGFFAWLRGLVGPVCELKGLGSIDKIPARVTVPSFGVAAAKAELLIRDIVEEAGWNLDHHAPILHEPLANSIGAFSEGRNLLMTHGQGPHYGQMFFQSGLTGAIREYILKEGSQYAWAMVVDLGGYTADFSMVGLDLDNIDARIEGEIDGKPRARQKSVPIGVTTLDEMIREMLPESKQELLRELERDPNQGLLERFHRDLYSALRPFSRRKVSIGEGKEMGSIVESVNSFAERIAENAVSFLDEHGYDRIDDLILTGGGCMIPTIQSALYDRLKVYGIRKAHMYMKSDSTFNNHQFHGLDYRLSRGATALGGASVYFDFAD